MEKEKQLTKDVVKATDREREKRLQVYAKKIGEMEKKTSKEDGADE